MARTAHTIARGHDGKWQLVATPDDQLIEQKRQFRLLRAAKSSEKYSQVIYQESDGPAEMIRLLTPKAQKKIEDQAAADRKAADEFSAKAAEAKPNKTEIKTGL